MLLLLLLQDGYYLYALPAIMPPKGLESARVQIDFGGPTTPAGTSFLVQAITLVKAGVSGMFMIMNIVVLIALSSCC
jgi:hypothetical protein